MKFQNLNVQSLKDILNVVSDHHLESTFLKKILNVVSHHHLVALEKKDIAMSHLGLSPVGTAEPAQTGDLRYSSHVAISYASRYLGSSTSSTTCSCWLYQL
jgi:hypothetical protein